jgi:hypothetical protein
MYYILAPVLRAKWGTAEPGIHGLGRRPPPYLTCAFLSPRLFFPFSLFALYQLTPDNGKEKLNTCKENDVVIFTFYTNLQTHA